MGRFVAMALAAFLIGGCTPKMGKDILIEPEGNVRFENTGAEMVLGILSILGASVKNEPIKLGSDLHVINHWHSDLKLVSLKYTLEMDKETIARGEAAADEAHPFIVETGSQKTLPLTLRIDPKRLTSSRVLGVIQAQRSILLKGDAFIEVWGMQKHYLFEKDATPIIQKALKKI